MSHWLLRDRIIHPSTDMCIIKPLLFVPVDSSESSGESVSGFSSSSHSYHSAVGGEAEDNSSVSAKEAAVAHATEASAVLHRLNALAGSPEKPPVAPKPKTKPLYQAKDLPCGKVQYKGHDQ